MKPYDLSPHRPVDKSGDNPSKDFSRQAEQDFPAAPVALKSTVKPANAKADTDSPALPAGLEAVKRGGDLYKPILVDVELLSREEEEALGRAIHESRERLTSSLSRVPAAFGVFVRLMTEADAGEKPITDALFAPFEAFKAFREADSARESANVEADSERKDWRRSAQAASQLYDEWLFLAGSETDSRTLDTARARLAKIASGLQPGFVALGEALRLCQKLDNRVGLIEQRLGMFHADVLDQNAPVEQRRALLRIQAEAGVNLTTLRECNRNAASAHAAYLKARDTMVNANLRLAYYMAHRLRGNGLSFDDLVQEAILGLMRAVDKFDYRLGYKFSTYAVQWIRQSTTRAIADDSRTIRVASHMHDEIVRLRKIARGLEQRLGTDPSMAQVAEVAGLAESKVAQVFRFASKPVSLDAPPAEVEDSPLSSIIADTMVEDPHASTHDDMLARKVAAILDTLPAREALIMRLRFGVGGREGRTLEEIGRMLGITRERTRQLESRAFGRLRETVDPDLLQGLDE